MLREKQDELLSQINYSKKKKFFDMIGNNNITQGNENVRKAKEAVGRNLSNSNSPNKSPSVNSDY